MICDGDEGEGAGGNDGVGGIAFATGHALVSQADSGCRKMPEVCQGVCWDPDRLQFCCVCQFQRFFIDLVSPRQQTGAGVARVYWVEANVAAGVERRRRSGTFVNECLLVVLRRDMGVVQGI